MTLNLILAAFGGGAIGALWGALPSFIFCGVLALAGNAIVAAGGPDTVVGLAFGPFFGPHIGFAGGVAAAAFAGKMKDLENGADITTPLAKFGKPINVIVGGCFGILGALILYLFTTVLGLGNLTNFDAIALTVATSGIISRLVFGKSGIVGVTGNGRSMMPSTNVMLFDLICGLGFGIIGAYVALETGLGSLPFAVSAFSLIFVQCGMPSVASHHITNCAAVSALASGNIFVGLVFGLVAAILCEIFGSVFNSKCDTHIDPPALTIATLTLVVALVF